MITVLIVDDSAFIRNAFSQMLRSDPEIEVVGTARDGEEAIELVRRLNPNIVTLDVEMPKRDGLSALQVIMKEMPRPVIMVSTLTSEGAEATLKALEYGAADFIPKYAPGHSSINLNSIQVDLCEKVKAVARSKRFVRLSANRLSPIGSPTQYSPPSGVRVAPPVSRTGRITRDCVAIGVSTGGPPAVQKVLAALPGDFPAYILIAQHMPGTFTGAFAKRLDGVCKINVKEAEDGERPKPNWAYVAPGGKHLRLEGRGTMPYISVSTEPADALYKPCVNVLMESVGKLMGNRTLGLIMTGMGNDGMEGMKLLKQKGGYAIAQSENTCVVYGMPKAIVDAGLTDEIADLDDLANVIQNGIYR